MSLSYVVSPGSVSERCNRQATPVRDFMSLSTQALNLNGAISMNIVEIKFGVSNFLSLNIQHLPCFFGSWFACCFSFLELKCLLLCSFTSSYTLLG